MTDAVIAGIGRHLAQALARRAYERDAESSKAVAQLLTELCAAVRSENEEETQKSSAQAASEESHDRPAST